MDWRAGHLNTTEGTGDGAFANKNCPQGRAFEIFFIILLYLLYLILLYIIYTLLSKSKCVLYIYFALLCFTTLLYQSIQLKAILATSIPLITFYYMSVLKVYVIQKEENN